MLWFLRRGLECAVGVQRRMVEKRIERVREKEKSVLYKVAAGKPAGGNGTGPRKGSFSVSERTGAGVGGSGAGSFDPTFQAPHAAVLSETDTARIEAQLSPEQLQLFAEENDSMLKHYEDTLGKVQYVSLFFFMVGRFCWMMLIRCSLETPRNLSLRSPLCRKRLSLTSLRRRSIFLSLFRMWIRHRQMSDREIAS